MRIEINPIDQSGNHAYRYGSPYRSRCYWVDWQHNKAPYEKSLEEKLAIDVVFL